MGITARTNLYQKLERLRGCPLIVYVTSERGNAAGQISSDAVREMHLQLEALPKGAMAADLLIVSNGGDPTVAWRLVSLIRERVNKFSVLIPQAAYSAATLIALGADEIVMHPNGNLGPTDPQIKSPRKSNPDGSSETIQFGSEDLSAFLNFVRDEVGLSDQDQLAGAFGKFCDTVGPVPIGVAARSSQLSITMGEKLLLLHMTSDAAKQKARTIAETLTKNFFHHGYPVSRTEAEQIGLKIAKKNEEIESVIWDIWMDIACEMEVRKPFLPMRVLKSNPDAAALFAPVPQAQIPSGLPADVLQQVIQQLLAQIGVQQIPAVSYTTIHAVMESARVASKFEIKGDLLASRQADLQIKIAQVVERQEWITVQLRTTQNKATKKVVSKNASKKTSKKATKKTKKKRTVSKKHS